MIRLLCSRSRLIYNKRIHESWLRIWNIIRMIDTENLCSTAAPHSYRSVTLRQKRGNSNKRHNELRRNGFRFILRNVNKYCLISTIAILKGKYKWVYWWIFYMIKILIRPYAIFLVKKILSDICVSNPSELQCQ